jgi:hypothetical protein
MILVVWAGSGTEHRQADPMLPILSEPGLTSKRNVALKRNAIVGERAVSNDDYHGRCNNFLCDDSNSSRLIDEKTFRVARTAWLSRSTLN